MASHTINGSFSLGTQVVIANPSANVDKDYGPYDSFSDLPSTYQDTFGLGKTIGIISEGEIVEWWLQIVPAGTTGSFTDKLTRQNIGWVEKQVSSSGYRYDSTKDSLAEGVDISMGSLSIASGDRSHAEGLGTTAGGDYSHAEGNGTITQNAAEHAEGKYNKSTIGSGLAPFTLHSVGIGTSNNDRENAFEIMSNGDMYINGVGSYDGTNPDSTAKTIQTVIDDLDTALGDINTALATIIGNS